MARIRAIKPEFWGSPGIETMDPYARLLFVAMWNWADDCGTGSANPRELLGFAFPNDDELTVVELRRWLVEIRRVFGVTFYTVAGRPYYSIPSWEKHQKFDRRSGGKHPGPEQADEGSDLVEPGEKLPIRGIPTSPRRDAGVGTGEQGNRGTEEVGSKETSPTPPATRPTAVPDRFDEFWRAYPRREGKGKAQTAWAVALRKVSADEIIGGALRYASDPNRDPAFTKHPTTWLTAECWFDDALPPRRGSSQQMSAVRQPTTRERKIAELELRKTNPNPAIVEQGGLTIPNDHPSLTGQATLQILEGGAA